jgi:hypothetical protein
MIDFLLLIVFAAALNWAVIEIYFYSIVFEPLRKYGAGWEQSTGYFRKHFRYLLQCPFCLSHWTAAVNLAILWVLGYCGCLPTPLLFPVAVIAIPVVARLSLTFKDWSLPPIVSSYESTTEPAGTDETTGQTETAGGNPD